VFVRDRQKLKIAASTQSGGNLNTRGAGLSVDKNCCHGKNADALCSRKKEHWICSLGLKHVRVQRYAVKKPR
jgi:hypothetical protein